jgi:hypothetical protein
MYRVPLFRALSDAYAGRMDRSLFFTLFGLALLTAALGAAKPHIINIGKSTAIKWLRGRKRKQVSRPEGASLYVDGRARESTLGPSHEITERLVVFSPCFPMNDNLPGDKAAAPGWLWQRGGCWWTA